MPNESTQSFILRTLSRNGVLDLSTVYERCCWGLCPSVPIEHAHLFSQIDINKLQKLYKSTNLVIRDNYGNIIGKLCFEKFNFSLTLTFKRTFFPSKKKMGCGPKTIIRYCRHCIREQVKEYGFHYFKHQWLYQRDCEVHNYSLETLNNSDEKMAIQNTSDLSFLPSWMNDDEYDTYTYDPVSSLYVCRACLREMRQNERVFGWTAEWEQEAYCNKHSMKKIKIKARDSHESEHLIQKILASIDHEIASKQPIGLEDKFNSSYTLVYCSTNKNPVSNSHVIYRYQMTKIQELPLYFTEAALLELKDFMIHNVADSIKPELNEGIKFPVGLRSKKAVHDYFIREHLTYNFDNYFGLMIENQYDEMMAFMMNSFVFSSDIWLLEDGCTIAEEIWLIESKYAANVSSEIDFCSIGQRRYTQKRQQTCAMIVPSQNHTRTPCSLYLANLDIEL